MGSVDRLHGLASIRGSSGCTVGVWLITWIPYKMSLVKYNNNQLNNIVNTAVRTAANVYGINPNTANAMVNIAGKVVKGVANSIKNRSPKDTQPKVNTVVVTQGRKKSSWSRVNRSAPVAVGGSSGANRRSNNYRLQNCERIMDIGGTNTGIFSIPINPGIASTFPWLSSIANSYDKYLFHRLIFRYKSTCPTSTSGQVILAWDYDSLDPTPTTAQECCQETYWKATSPWQHMGFSVNLNGIGKLFTRDRVIAGSDLKTYDLGQLIVLSDNNQASGYVEVEYDLTLYDKQPEFINSAVKTNTSIYLLNTYQNTSMTATSYAGLTVSNTTYVYNIDYTTHSFDTTSAVVYNLPTGMTNMLSGNIAVFKMLKGLYKVYWHTDASGIKAILMKAIRGPGTNQWTYTPLKQTYIYDGCWDLVNLSEDTEVSVCVVNNTSSAITTSNTHLSFMLEAV